MLNTPTAVFLFLIKYNSFSVTDKGLFRKENQQGYFLPTQAKMWKNYLK